MLALSLRSSLSLLPSISRIAHNIDLSPILLSPILLAVTRLVVHVEGESIFLDASMASTRSAMRCSLYRDAVARHCDNRSKSAP